MRNPQRLGVVFLSIGLGILIVQLFPYLTWLWPLGLMVGGLMLWRRPKSSLLALAVVLVSLTVGILPQAAVSIFWGGGSVIASYESSAAQEESWQDVQRVVVTNTVGDVSISGNAEAVGIEVVYRRTRSGADAPGELQVHYDEASQTLLVTGIDPAWPPGRRRGLAAELELELPSVAVEVSGQVGDLKAADVRSAELRTHTGSITVQRVANEVVAVTDVGDINIEDVLGALEVRSRVGDINLTFEQPLMSPVDAKTDVGDVELLLPSGSDVTVRAYSQLRDLEGELEQVTASEGRLRLGTGTHEVELSTRVGEVQVMQR